MTKIIHILHVYLLQIIGENYYYSKIIVLNYSFLYVIFKLEK